MGWIASVQFLAEKEVLLYFTASRTALETSLLSKGLFPQG
jgi:hypothetical protein